MDYMHVFFLFFLTNEKCLKMLEESKSTSSSGPSEILVGPAERQLLGERVKTARRAHLVSTCFNFLLWFLGGWTSSLLLLV